MSALRDAARSAVIWNAGFNVFRDALQFATMLYLVRRLPPEAYGQFGATTGVMGFLSVLTFAGCVAHSLQVQTDADARFQEHFTCGALLNTAAFLIANLTALALWQTSTYSEIAPLIHIASITFLLEWPCELRRKMIERAHDWRKLRSLHAIGLLLASILAIVLASRGAGVLALVIPGMAATLPFIYDLFVTQRWRPTWQWSWEDYKPSARFAVARLGSGVVEKGRVLIEATAFAAILGFAELGIMNRSLGLAQLFCVKVSQQLLYAIYPVLTRIEDHDGRPSKATGLVLQAVFWISVPTAVALASLAIPAVDIVYGPTWSAVSALVPIAMLWGFLTCTQQALYSLLLGRGGERACLAGDGILLAGSLAALAFALPHGVDKYLIALSTAQLVTILFLAVRLSFRKALPFGSVGRSLFSACVAISVAWLIANQLWGGSPPLPDGPVVGFIAWITLLAIAYVAALRLLFRPQVAALTPYLPASRLAQRLLRI